MMLYAKTGRDLAAIRLAEIESQSPQSFIGAALKNALSPGNQQLAGQTTVSFEPTLEASRSSAPRFRTVAEMNETAASSIREELLASLVESAARLGQYDRAIAIERLRAADAAKAGEQAAIEKR